MAQLFTDDPNLARVSIPITKFEEAEDGAIYVYGKATDATLDRDDQIIDPKFAAKSLADWFESGANVRVMHSPALYPAGKGVELISGDDGQYLKSRIVEPTAIKLVKEKVLSAYSVGISHPQVIGDTIAKRGRVVGGETVEVSLVDRPSNPSCGVMLAKMASGEVQLTEQDFVGDEPTITLGENTFTPADFASLLVKLGKAEGAKPAETEPDETDKVAETDLDKNNSKKNCPKCSKTFNADTDKTHCDKCGTKLPAAKVAEPDLEKSDDGMPLGLRRLHDVTCAAYSWIDVKEAHPVLEKNGLAGALGPSATSLLYRMLEHEISEDGGTGREARDVAHLAKAYELLNIFLSDEAMEAHVMAEARADLHKMFKASNPMAPEHMTPVGPGKNPDPSRFTRPYISGGHANDSAKSGQHPRIPAASHVPAASQFTRGTIDAGHAADSPMNGSTGSTPSQSSSMTTPTKAPGEGKAVEADLTKAGARERAQAALIAVHDHLADEYPDACIMIPHATDIAHQPLADTTELANGATNTPKNTGVEADLVKMMDTDVVKAAIGELIEARFKTEREDYESKLADLQRQYEELAAQPDPNQAAYRGMTGIEQLLGKRSQDSRDEVTEREHKINQYARWLDSPDPAQREAARSLLTKMAR